jgi:hypothetical protein
MKVWVEDSAVENVNDKLFMRTGGGTRWWEIQGKERVRA